MLVHKTNIKLQLWSNAYEVIICFYNVNYKDRNNQVVLNKTLLFAKESSNIYMPGAQSESLEINIGQEKIVAMAAIKPRAPQIP